MAMGRARLIRPGSDPRLCWLVCTLVACWYVSVHAVRGSGISVQEVGVGCGGGGLNW